MPTETTDPYKFTLKDTKRHQGQQERLDKALCQLVTDTVLACQDRDDDLKDLRRQLEMWSEGPLNTPWPGACQIQETISRELHTTTTAAIWQAAKQVPYVCLEPVEAQDMDAASDVETWMNIKAQQYGYESALYNAIYLANEGRFSWMYVGHQQEMIRSFELQDMNIGGEEPERELVMSEVPSDPCIELRTPDPWDCYTFPVTARGPKVSQGCLNTIERMCLTQEDLMLGVINNGYNAKAVSDMIEKGPARLAYDDDEMQRDGLDTLASTNTRESGTYECFLVIGRCPLLPDDNFEPTIPEALMHTDCLWMVCPALSIVFQQIYSPFPDSERPYAVFNVIEKPNRMLGEGIVSLLSQTDDEMTAIVRFGINNMNLEASPMMSVAESWLTRYSKWTVAPGRLMPRQPSDPVGPKPITWDVRSQVLIMPWLQYLDGKAGRMAASQSVNSGMAGKSRKAAEVHFAEAMIQTKFDLFLANIQRGVKETFRLMMAILLKHMNEDGDTATTAQGATVQVTPQQLKQKFRFLPQASTDAISPATRLARQEAIKQMVNEYWAGFPMWSQIGILPNMWHLYHRLLVLAQERSPERYIGPEPAENSQPNPQMALMMQQQAQGGGQGGGPSPNGNMGGGLLQASAMSPHATNGARY